MVSVAVVIPNFNGADILGDCLTAVAAQTAPTARVVVVDNASADESLTLLRRDWPDVQVVACAENHGFAGGVNRGIAVCTEDRVAVLNSDARPRADWLERLLAAPQDDDVWAWGSVLVSPRDGTVESAGDCWDVRGFAYKAARGAALEALPAGSFEVFAPPGACPLVRRDVVDALGGYDERFFLYYEDLDLAFRARLHGLRALLVPDAVVEHDLGGSGNLDRTRFYVARNSIACAAMNAPDLHPRALWKGLRHDWDAARRDGYVRAHLRGRRAALARLPGTVRERRRRQAARVASAADVERAYGLPPAIAHLGPQWP
ncbi:MAG: glycosyltransferase family 2 protein [Solirubrobacteraceae bacterium]